MIKVDRIDKSNYRININIFGIKFGFQVNIKDNNEQERERKTPN